MTLNHDDSAINIVQVILYELGEYSSISELAITCRPKATKTDTSTIWALSEHCRAHGYNESIVDCGRLRRLQAANAISYGLPRDQTTQRAITVFMVGGQSMTRSHHFSCTVCNAQPSRPQQPVTAAV